MSRALSVIRGNSGFASAITWLPDEVLEDAYPQARAGGRAATLAAICDATDIDLAFIPAHVEWAEEAVHLLSASGTTSAWAIGGVFGRVADQIGWTEALRMSINAPGELLHMLDSALHGVLTDARAGLAAGAEVLVLADDLAGAGGWLVAPDFALDSLAPCYRHAVAQTANAGAPWIFHSDGDVRAIYPVLARSGFSAVHVGGDADIAAASAAADASGMSVLGGLRIRDLVTRGLRSSASELVSLASTRPIVVCDDGGISSTDDLWAYLAAAEEARESWRSLHG